MNPTDCKTTLQSKIEDCTLKIGYYASYTDTVMSAYWKGRKEAYEDVIQAIDDIPAEGAKQPIKKIKT